MDDEVFLLIASRPPLALALMLACDRAEPAVEPTPPEAPPAADPAEAEQLRPAAERERQARMQEAFMQEARKLIEMGGPCRDRDDGTVVYDVFADTGSSGMSLEEALNQADGSEGH